MKNLQVIIFLLLFSHYTVFASSINVSLIEVRNDSGGGIIFVFQVNGKISKANLNNGFVQVEGGDAYGLHCNQIDDTRVQCNTSKKTSGKNVVVGFAGSKFWAYVPESKPVEVFYQCYSVYDWDDNFFPTTWVRYGEHCQDFPPEDKDVINWVNPSLFPPYVYLFSSAFQPDWCPSLSGLGPGYYYFYCP